MSDQPDPKPNEEISEEWLAELYEDAKYGLEDWGKWRYNTVIIQLINALRATRKELAVECALYKALDEKDSRKSERIAELEERLADAIGGGMVLLGEKLALQQQSQRAQMCWTCGGIPHTSEIVCVCGGSGNHVDEVNNLRRAALAKELSDPGR